MGLNDSSVLCWPQNINKVWCSEFDVKIGLNFFCYVQDCFLSLGLRYNDWFKYLSLACLGSEAKSGPPTRTSTDSNVIILLTRSIGPLRGSTSSWEPFGPAWLRPSRPSALRLCDPWESQIYKMWVYAINHGVFVCWALDCSLKKNLHK